MKANRKSKEERKNAGVSAVVGVILMVAITVSMAAVVYVYANDLVGTGMTLPPTLTFLKQGNDLVVLKCSPDLPWNLMKINITGGTNPEVIMPTIGNIEAGQSIRLVNSSGATLRIVYGATLLGSWKWA